MAADFKYIIVGRGMMGAAAARHLTRWTDGVALLGPDEPADARTHRGVFGSHYDEARITRTIDPDGVWALLANRSIARYRDLEKESGVDFYHEVGCLMVGPERQSGHAYLKGILKAAADLGVKTETLGSDELTQRFPYFGFEANCEGVFEAANAGYVNPRALVKAQATVAERQGARLIRETAVSIRDEGGLAVVRTAEGAEWRAEKVLLAAGGFSIAENLLPRPVEMSVYARTVAFFEISEDELQRYTGMPSLIYEPRDPTKHIYLLPPVRYPDGKVYLKIGGDPDDVILTKDEDMRAWFRSGGRASVRDHLSEIVAGLVPDVDRSRISMGACVVSKTPSGYPAIAYTNSPRVAVLTGGCGTAAKSSDEIGRLGAELMHEARIRDEAYSVPFVTTFQ
ncbi:NAD(P)/FAD-dependent oxidoreductase [Rhizobium oryzicola]|uniref:FAD-dependent oxidoreductase n=1 Tax=Rhizobium oryzicola TaxID=1232668 RepID=A0ABT8T1A5_9HYPH|nr:FAD-dependent oxidoreductase [Rhizobium oryzicola]MDO1584507.1 FAD-dependent oxidoreductase [Rhizobium oryzicola]